MNRILLLALSFPLGLASCNPVSGVWMGTCDFADGTYAYAADVTVDLKGNGGSNLTGTMTVDLWDGQTMTGDVEGLRTGVRLSLEGSFVVESQGYLMIIEAEEAGPDYEGECRFDVPGGGGYLVGKIDLEQ